MTRTILTLVTLVLVLASSSTAADLVELRNGEKLEGTVVSESLMLRTTDATVTVPLSSVARVTLGPPDEKPGTPTELVLDLGGGVTMRLVPVPAGSFVMGSPESEDGRRPDEGPQHTVTLAKPFHLGATEVTQAQWEAVMGTNPCNFKGPARPVEQVSWTDAMAFCTRLGKTTGHKLRLPSEAEWEYAARAGTTQARHGDADAVAWHHGTSGSHTQDVGTKAANAWGLHDMLGNVWEWCEDAYHPTYEGAPVDGSAWAGRGNRILRGGSWSNRAPYSRAAQRNQGSLTCRFAYHGFRVVAPQ